MRKLFWIVLLTLTTTGVVQGQEPGNAEVQPVIEQMRAGLEQHNLQNMLAAFDERAIIELGRAANGWKIRELSPRAFFQ